MSVHKSTLIVKTAPLTGWFLDAVQGRHSINGNGAGYKPSKNSPE